jgi:hypothetical protein
MSRVRVTRVTNAGSSSSSCASPGTPRETDWLVERVSQRTAKLVLDELVELLGEKLTPAPWTTAGEVAAHLKVSTDVIYRLADLLGAVRIGDGPKPRLRFPPLERIDVTILSASGRSDAEGSPTAARVAPRRRRRVTGTGAPLLPIAGEERPSSGGSTGDPSSYERSAK